MSFNVLKIKRLIFEKNITQEVLCAEIGVTKQTLINYFNGRTKLDVFMLGKIADFFNVSVSYFYDDESLELKEPKEEYKRKTKKYLEQRMDELEKRVEDLENKL